MVINRSYLKRILLGGCLAASLFAFDRPVQAVVILDSTWQSEGGTRNNPAAGFGAHLRLAAEPQFQGVLALSSDGESWGEASATWIGNDGRYAYLLTAAHVYDLPAEPEDYVVRTPGGEVRRVDRIWTHPKWNGDVDTRTGFDLAILRLPKPITDAGAPPTLYSGDEEAGELITFVGFGSRGRGSVGEKERYYRGSDKAAAQGIVDQWVPLAKKVKKSKDSGNYLGIYLPKEDGSVPNPYDGETKPASRLVGLLGTGDSGGSAWMKADGNWVIVAVNSNGDGKARYGDSSWFARVSPHRDWIESIFPGARFSP